jgi:hypothetical protein
MPKRNYQIFNWGEGQTIDERFDEVRYDEDIKVLAIKENSTGGGRYVLKITDGRNLDNPVLFEIVANAEGRVTNFQVWPPNIELYSKAHFCIRSRK